VVVTQTVNSWQVCDQAVDEPSLLRVYQYESDVSIRPPPASQFRR